MLNKDIASLKHSRNKLLFIRHTRVDDRRNKIQKRLLEVGSLCFFIALALDIDIIIHTGHKAEPVGALLFMIVSWISLQLTVHPYRPKAVIKYTQPKAKKSSAIVYYPNGQSKPID